MTVPSPRPQAFSLIEVTVALGIAAFALIAIFGLLPVGLSSNQNASLQTEAGDLVTALVADLAGTPASATASGIYQIPYSSTASVFYLTPAANTTGSTGYAASTTLTGDARFRVSIQLDVPSSGSAIATTGSIALSWPAAAAPKKALGRFETFVAFDRN